MKVLISALFILILVSCGGTSYTNNVTATVVPQNSNIKIDDFTNFGRGFVRLYDKENSIVCYAYVDDTTHLQCLKVSE